MDIGEQNIIIIFTTLAITIFAFNYWRDATKEGFSSDKILDSFALLLIGGLLGGKLLFRSLNYDYFRYQLLTSPLILEGVLVGGALAAFYIIRRNEWDGWKVGDMISPALASFQMVVFLGIWIRVKEMEFALISGAFVLLYLFIRFLKTEYRLGSSDQYFIFKRADKPVFTGGLFGAYLTGSSLIAIIFLVTHVNISSWFWVFQVVFYFSILVATYILLGKRLRLQGIYMKVFTDISGSMLGKLKASLSSRYKKIKGDRDQLTVRDPYMHEAKVEAGRDRDDELGDAVTSRREHEVVEASKRELDREAQEIEKSLQDIKAGTYGICEKCGRPIPPERLEAYPTAKTCLKCTSGK